MYWFNKKKDIRSNQVLCLATSFLCCGPYMKKLSCSPWNNASHCCHTCTWSLVVQHLSIHDMFNQLFWLPISSRIIERWRPISEIKSKLPGLIAASVNNSTQKLFIATGNIITSDKMNNNEILCNRSQGKA